MPITTQLTLTGNPIAYGRFSKALAFVQRPYVAATLLALAFGAAAHAFSAPPSAGAVGGDGVRSASALLELKGSFAFLSVWGGLCVQMNNYIQSRTFTTEGAGKKAVSVCIETKPSESTPRNTKKWKDFAQERLGKDRKTLASVAAGAGLWVALSSFVQVNPWVIWGGVAGATSLMLYDGNAVTRWKNVLNDTWRIVELTPPEKKTATLPLPAPNGLA